MMKTLFVLLAYICDVSFLQFHLFRYLVYFECTLEQQVGCYRLYVHALLSI